MVEEEEEGGGMMSDWVEEVASSPVKRIRPEDMQLGLPLILPKEGTTPWSSLSPFMGS